jgi:L-threonylcarbamoyladenylate synthase
VSPTTAGDVRADLGDDVDIVLDDGPCTVGVESTIVDCTGDELVILRPGGVTRECIEEVSGQAVGARTDGLVRAPGTLKSHYAPEATVLVVGRQDLAERATALLAAGERVAVLVPDPIPALPADLVVLDAPTNGDEYARVLYARLREADRRGVDVLLAVSAWRWETGCAAPPAGSIRERQADRRDRLRPRWPHGAARAHRPAS